MYFRPDLLKGKTAFITGGGTGIGFEMARGLGQVGAKVIIASRSQNKLEPATSKLRDMGIDVHWKLLNIHDPDAVFKVVDEIIEEHQSIDVLVANAGGQFPAKAEDITPNGWKTVIDLNLNGTFYCCSAVGRHMIKRGGGGKILNMSASFIDRGSGGIMHRGATCAAISQMTRTLAVEWAQFNIQVNAIGPQYLSSGLFNCFGAAGSIDSSFPKVSLAGRWATGDEIGAWAVILCSSLSDYVTGTTLYLDGGAWLQDGINVRGTPVCPE